jgi:hypothetical protein
MLLGVAFFFENWLLYGSTRRGFIKHRVINKTSLTGNYEKP